MFKGYLSAPDKEFNMYIKQKKNDIEEGQEISKEEIMVMAEKKYKSLKRGKMSKTLFRRMEKLSLVHQAPDVDTA